MENTNSAKSTTTATSNAPPSPALTKRRKLLIESVAIIGIIVICLSFAIPQYQSFQQKARQKEATTLLNSVHVALQATSAEQGVLPTTLEESGFSPAGKLHYKIHTTTSTLTPNELEALPETFLPFLNVQGYRIIATLAAASPDHFEFCKIEQKNSKVECMVIKK